MDGVTNSTTRCVHFLYVASCGACTERFLELTFSRVQALTSLLCSRLVTAGQLDFWALGPVFPNALKETVRARRHRAAVACRLVRPATVARRAIVTPAGHWPALKLRSAIR